jgi:hypothetical protein
LWLLGFRDRFVLVVFFVRFVDEVLVHAGSTIEPRAA